MVQKQPISGFKWLERSLTEKEIMSWDVDGQYGCFVEADLTIPPSLHDKFSDYPLAPEPLTITEEIASPTSLMIRKKRNGKSEKFASEKLAPNLFAKTKYKCHIRNLQFYLKEGVKLEAVHRVLTFKQEAWIAPYIMYNTEKRQNATNDFQKAYYKLLNNAFFGKTMESVRKRINVVLINKERQQKYQVNIIIL